MVARVLRTTQRGTLLDMLLLTLWSDLTGTGLTRQAPHCSRGAMNLKSDAILWMPLLTHRMGQSRFASWRINSSTPAKWTRKEVHRSHNLPKDSRLMRIPPKTVLVIRCTLTLIMITITKNVKMDILFLVIKSTHLDAWEVRDLCLQWEEWNRITLPQTLISLKAPDRTLYNSLK